MPELVDSSNAKDEEAWWRLELPGGEHAYLPSDLKAALPSAKAVSPDRLHLLAYIPWSGQKYLDKIPEPYREFFSFVVPYLGARTTDVHTALSVAALKDLIAETKQPVREPIAYVAVILHDSGWSQMSQAEIADSLDYSAFSYSDKALAPKERHATLGAEMTTKLLNAFPGDLGLSKQDEDFIAELVYYHDQVRPWPVDKKGPEPIEYLLLGDADRMWSYTHENFWLDTIRKNVPPEQYVENIDKAIDGYFLTEQGRAIAKKHIAARYAEVKQLTESLAK